MNFKLLPYHQEEQWIRACRQGDSAAQRQLYEKYARRMMGVCIRYLGDTFEAEDVLITGFMRVFEKVSQFKGEGSLEGWIRKIIVNEALSHLRRNKRMYLETDLEKADYEPDFQRLSHHLETEDLLRMIEQLPTGYKTVFNLYAIEGYSHKEIAEMLQISESTSKSQLCRARALLQQHLAQSENQLKVTQYGNGR
jgi:RNA polymerase sigma-70 factor (ECF subfamily)